MREWHKTLTALIVERVMLHPSAVLLAMSSASQMRVTFLLPDFRGAQQFVTVGEGIVVDTFTSLLR